VASVVSSFSTSGRLIAGRGGVAVLRMWLTWVCTLSLRRGMTIGSMVIMCPKKGESLCCWMKLDVLGSVLQIHLGAGGSRYLLSFGSLLVKSLK
jgi:hypothetical protein